MYFYFFIPAFDKILFFFISILECLSSFFSSISLFTFVISKPNIIIIILYYVLLYLSFKYNYKFLITYFIILFININSRYLNFNPEITFLDVGQGDSMVIILPIEKVIMVDTGGNMLGSSIAENKIIPYLNSRGINKIEWLILTHGDYDHMGESIDLVNNFKVKKVIFNVGDYNNLEINLIKVLEKKNIPYYQNIERLNIGNVKLYFLNTKDYDDENENSSVIYTKINNVKMLFMGDAGETKEKDLISEYNLYNIDILKVGHHGSNMSSSKKFIGKIIPKTCLISVGKNNQYGHPKESVLDILHNCNTYRTDLNGSLKIKVKNNKYIIKTISK